MLVYEIMILFPFFTFIQGDRHIEPVKKNVLPATSRETETGNPSNLEFLES
jgi:hypothetical protein